MNSLSLSNCGHKHRKNSQSDTRPSRALACMVLMGAALSCAMPAWASGDVEPLNLLTETGSAGFGAIVRSDPSPYVGGSTRADILPLYLYEGERLFLDANRAGVKLFNGQDHRIDIFAAQRLEGFTAQHLPSGVAGMALRDSGVDLGVSWRYRQAWGTVQAEWLSDVDSRSKGNELRLGYSYDWRSGPWQLRPSISVSRRDAKLNNYYYGVQSSEATPGRPAYAPGAGVNTTLGLYGSYDVSQRWRLLAGVSATLLDRKIKDSPIVKSGLMPSVYVGAAYDFGRHEREWRRESSPTWFKVLYGKSTDDGCHLLKIVTAQCLSTASVNSTSITGIQVGKPFLEKVNGWPLDFVGYAGLTHHNDCGLQANGLQLDLFMKAVYSGFPWNDRVRTRLGFGAGVSAAQRAPYIEVSSQAAAGKSTSRVLQYLEPTLDVNLGDIVGARALKETYLGLGVSHRSGIFGGSRLLGNVSGGSNYIYTYVESAF